MFLMLSSWKLESKIFVTTWKVQTELSNAKNLHTKKLRSALEYDQFWKGTSGVMIENDTNQTLL